MPEPDPLIRPVTPDRRRRVSALLLVVALLAGGVLTATGLYALGAFSTEIVALPYAAEGEDPFAPSIGDGQPVNRPQGKTGISIAGDSVGLYGGTLNDAACDRTKLVTYLQQNPEKGAAWATVLGIAPDGIANYVAELTPMILRSDTAVTNHGFADGTATTLDSVLEAGSAVLVDKMGVPRVRCKCGNPLTPARNFSRPSYPGGAWPAFSADQITTVQPAALPITTFVVINLANDSTTIDRPAGTAGERDEGRLEDATFGREYTLTRTVSDCGNAERCQRQPIPIEITCESASTCTLRRLDGRWLSSHPLVRDGSVWRAQGPEAGAYDCNFVPQEGTVITFEITPVTAAVIDGSWQVVTMHATYSVDASATAGCDGEPGAVASFQLAN
ncbi:DUF6777 domain-containing protein [Pseudonocardia sp.]|uniref:DUF6777 domain-containing protein n=1 Tax=Pseudonocardia sp. TaxID=60912 RepID=UPI003D14D818